MNGFLKDLKENAFCSAFGCTESGDRITPAGNPLCDKHYELWRTEVNADGGDVEPQCEYRGQAGICTAESTCRLVRGNRYFHVCQNHYDYFEANPSTPVIMKLPHETDKQDHDPVAHPRHYTEHPSGIECITITEHMGFTLGNVMKYVWRADMKGGLEDLEKASWYLQREISKRKAKSNV